VSTFHDIIVLRFVICINKKKFVGGLVKAQTQWKNTMGEKALWVKAAKDYI